VAADRRDALRADLAAHGIETRVYYERGLHREPCFAGATAAPLPETEAACREVLALPIRPDLDPADREQVAERVVAFLFR
jgi:dTDP-4-amino-4,6-dideoxygalactose transaminase